MTPPKPKRVVKLKQVTESQVDAVLSRARSQLAKKRDDLALSRRELAEQIGGSISNLTKLEHGDRGGSIALWIAVAIALDLTMAQLFDAPSETASTSARDRRTPYAGERTNTTDAQLQALLDAARKLDINGIKQLTKVARLINREKK